MWHEWGIEEVRIGFLVLKAKGKRQLGKPRRRWEDNIKTGVQQIGWDGLDWFDLAQDSVRWRVKNFQVP